MCGWSLFVCGRLCVVTFLCVVAFSCVVTFLCVVTFCVWVDAFCVGDDAGVLSVFIMVPTRKSHNPNRTPTRLSTVSLQLMPGNNYWTAKIPSRSPQLFSTINNMPPEGSPIRSMKSLNTTTRIVLGCVPSAAGQSKRKTGRKSIYVRNDANRNAPKTNVTMNRDAGDPLDTFNIRILVAFLHTAWMETSRFLASIIVERNLRVPMLPLPKQKCQGIMPSAAGDTAVELTIPGYLTDNEILSFRFDPKDCFYIDRPALQRSCRSFIPTGIDGRFVNSSRRSFFDRFCVHQSPTISRRRSWAWTKCGRKLKAPHPQTLTESSVEPASPVENCHGGPTPNDSPGFKNRQIPLTLILCVAGI